MRYPFSGTKLHTLLVALFSVVISGWPLSSTAQLQYCNLGEGAMYDGPWAQSNVGYFLAELLKDNSKDPDREVTQFIGDGIHKPVCTLLSGMPWTSAIRLGNDQLFRSYKNKADALAHIKARRAEEPTSVFLALAEVDYWISSAWDARGSGYGSSVTEEGWQLYRQRLQNAEKILLESKPYASIQPTWYEQMVIVQSALNREGMERAKTFQEGAKKHKAYPSLYLLMVYFSLPKWGGSWEAVDNLVAWSVGNTKEIGGDMLYARSYWYVHSNLSEEEDLFRDTHASWQKMKKGFEDLMQRHPQSLWNLLNFSKFACLAGDKTTYLSLRKELEGRPLAGFEDAWIDGLSKDLCDYKMGYTK